jgi:hypothetical protein
MVGQSALRPLSRLIGILGRISSGRAGWLSGPCWAGWLCMSVTSVFTLEALEQFLEQAAGPRLL